MWGFVAATIGSALLGNKANKDAAKSSEAGQLAGIESQERMFERGLELQEPYREAGYGALEGLQGMLEPGGRAQSLQDYYRGAEFQTMEGQVEQGIARRQGATGGMRGGGTQAAMAGIAPQLGQQFLAGQQNQYTNLANMGMGAAAQGAQGAQQLGAGISNQYGNIGNIQGQASINRSNIFSGALGTLGGIGMDYFQGRGKV